MPENVESLPAQEVLVRWGLRLFCGLWVVACAALGVFVVWPAFMQWRAEAFALADGTVTTSEVVDRRGHDFGRVPQNLLHRYDVAITYTYRVGDDRVIGSRYRFGVAHRQSTRAAAQRLADRLSPGTDVAVYFDPSRPTRAVLEPGLVAGDRALLLFTLPFGGVLALIAWRFACEAFRDRLRPETGGVRVHQWPNRLRIERPGTTPVDAAVLGFCVAAFLGSFAVLWWTNWAPSTPQVMLTLITSVSGAGVGVVVWLAQRWRRPDVTEIDVSNRTITLARGPRPQGLGKRKPGPWAERYDELLGVDINNEAGRAGEPQRRFPPSVVLHVRQDHEERAVCVCELTRTYRARTLAHWLKQRLPMPATALDAVR